MGEMVSKLGFFKEISGFRGVYKNQRPKIVADYQKLFGRSDKAVYWIRSYVTRHDDITRRSDQAVQ